MYGMLTVFLSDLWHDRWKYRHLRRAGVALHWQQLISSETDEGFGGINMVDPSYNGNYSGVVVSGNTIRGVGTGFFNLGIGIGSKVWSNPHDSTYSGPAIIEDNTFIGNIGFSIVVNGWNGGLTVSLNTRLITLPGPTNKSNQSSTSCPNSHLTLNPTSSQPSYHTTNNPTGNRQRHIPDNLTLHLLRRREHLPSPGPSLLQRQLAADSLPPQHHRPAGPPAGPSGCACSTRYPAP